MHAWAAAFEQAAKPDSLQAICWINQASGYPNKWINLFPKTRLKASHCQSTNTSRGQQRHCHFSLNIEPEQRQVQSHTAPTQTFIFCLFLLILFFSHFKNKNCKVVSGWHNFQILGQRAFCPYSQITPQGNQSVICQHDFISQTKREKKTPNTSPK